MPLSLLLCPSPSRLPTMFPNSRLPKVGAPAGGRGRHSRATRHPSHRRACLHRDGASGQGLCRRYGVWAPASESEATDLRHSVPGERERDGTVCGWPRRAPPPLPSLRLPLVAAPASHHHTGGAGPDPVVDTPLRTRARGRTTAAPAPCPDPVLAPEPPPWSLPPSSRPRAPSSGLRRREAGRGRIPCSASWPTELSRPARSNRRHHALQGWAREGNGYWEGILLWFQLALTRYLKPPFAHPEMGKLLETV
jgi:hypothetical protein